jgi:hypothetical protein
MKRWKTLALFAFAIAGAAFAQVRPSEFQPVWLERPSSRQITSTYPRKAIRAKQSGVAAMCCDVQDDGTLRCDLALEWPKDFGFGAAGVELSRHYRFAPESVEAFKLQPAQRFPLTIPFRIEPMSAATQASLDQAIAVAKRPEVCAAGASAAP